MPPAIKIVECHPRKMNCLVSLTECPFAAKPHRGSYLPEVGGRMITGQATRRIICRTSTCRAFEDESYSV